MQRLVIKDIILLKILNDVLPPEWTGFLAKVYKT